MLKQELAQLLGDVDTLLIDIASKTGIGPMQGKISRGDKTTSDTSSDPLNEFDADLSQGFEEALLHLDPGHGGNNIPDSFKERSSMWTDRQQKLIWYYDNFGVIGLAYQLKEIARAELLKETGMEPRIPSLYRKRLTPAKRPPPSGHIQVLDSQEEQTSCQFDSSALIAELKSLVDAQGPGPKSWRRIFYDWYRGGCSRMVFYLSSIPEEMMRAVLHGNLAERMLDTSFAQRFDRFVRLGQCPGTYSLYVARSPYGSQQATAYSPSLGGDSSELGLTLEELRSLHNIAQRYINIGDKAFVKHARRIDLAIGTCQRGLDYSYQRRYGAGKENNDFGSHREFLDVLKSNLLNWATELNRSGQDGALKIPLSRCFAHVGLSSNPLMRCPDHWTHAKEASPIFGMITAILETKWTGRFDLKDHSYQIFRVVRSEDMGFAEILSSMISSAYHWDLGLSYTFAGGGGQAQRSAQLSARFKENSDRIREINVGPVELSASVKKIEKMGTDWQQKKALRQTDAVCTKSMLESKCTRLEWSKENNLQKLSLALMVCELEDLCGRVEDP